MLVVGGVYTHTLLHINRMQLSSTKLEYVPVSPNDSEKGQADIFLDKLKPKYGLLWWSSRNTLLLAIPWLLAILFASVSLILLIERYSASSTFGTYETYFKADLGKHIPQVHRFCIVDVRFSS